MCLRLRIRTSVAITSISNRRNYSSQVLPDSYSDGSLESQFKKRYEFFEARSLQPPSKNWQEQRKYKLTASTFAAAIGFYDGRRVQLWLEKIGHQKPFDVNEATGWNNANEKEALERYKLITGNYVTQPKFQVYGNENRKDDWLGASPDGIVENRVWFVENHVYWVRSPGVLEIKCPLFKGDMNMAMPWKQIPHNHVPQAQGLMEIMDREWMDFYVWTPNGSSLYRLYRDRAYWQALREALADFWWLHVQPAREQYSRGSITDPVNQLPSLKPAPRHESYDRIVCESQRIVDTSYLVARQIHRQVQSFGS